MVKWTKLINLSFLSYLSRLMGEGKAGGGVEGSKVRCKGKEMEKGKGEDRN